MQKSRCTWVYSESDYNMIIIVKYADNFLIISIKILYCGFKNSSVGVPKQITFILLIFIFSISEE